VRRRINGVFAAVDGGVVIVGWTIQQTPRGIAELMNGSKVEQNVSNGDEILARREDRECCKK